MTPLEKQLYEALKEAVEWNWLDDLTDPPPLVTEQIDGALAEYERQLEQEQNSVHY